MPKTKTKPPRSHGDGHWDANDFTFRGEGGVIEEGVRIWHTEKLSLGDNVYVGHGTMLKGYHNESMIIGSGTWIGQMCFFHSAGGLTIGRNVGVGPCVKILTSYHVEAGRDVPILHSPIATNRVHIGHDCDIGVGAVILPGTILGKGVQVGAGAVVKGTFADYTVIAGVPARQLRVRPDNVASPQTAAEKSGIYDDSGVWL